MNPPEECPVCGESVPRGARACPGCGADERAGWDEEATRYDGLDLPNEAFDDTGSRQPRRSGAGPFWIGIAVILAVVLTLTFVFR